jgi:hypothetical protein
MRKSVRIFPVPVATVPRDGSRRKASSLRRRFFSVNQQIADGHAENHVLWFLRVVTRLAVSGRGLFCSSRAQASLSCRACKAEATLSPGFLTAILTPVRAFAEPSRRRAFDPNLWEGRRRGAPAIKWRSRLAAARPRYRQAASRRAALNARSAPGSTAMRRSHSAMRSRQT